MPLYTLPAADEYAPYYGNPGLQPEEARSAELGLQYAAEGQMLRLQWFSSRVANEFQYDFATNRFENIVQVGNLLLDADFLMYYRVVKPQSPLTRQELLLPCGHCRPISRQWVRIN